VRAISAGWPGESAVWEHGENMLHGNAQKMWTKKGGKSPRMKPLSRVFVTKLNVAW
jgi:hypothetical protein